MPQKDSHNYRAEAQKRWEQLQQAQEWPVDDPKALQALLKEAQISQLALLLENEALKNTQRPLPGPAEGVLTRLHWTEEQQRLHEVERLAQVGHWEYDVAQQKEHWSDELYYIFGYQPGAVAPSRAALLATVHPEDYAQAEAVHEQLLQGQPLYQLNYRLRPRGEHQPYLNERCTVEWDEDGRPKRLIGIVQDITTQKAQELTLKRSFKEIEDLQHALNQSSMVVVVDRAHCIRSANDLFCKTTQYRQEELIGAPFDTTDPNYHSRWFLQLMWETVEQGKVWKGELKNRTKGGAVYWTETAIIPFMDDLGLPEQYIILQHDISVKKALEEELDRSNEAEFTKLYHQQQQYLAEIEERSAEWDRFFKLSTEMISVIAVDGTIIRTNPAFVKALGFKPHELIGHHVSEFIHEADLTATTKMMERLKDGVDIMGYENRWKNYHGEYRWMSWRAVMDQETQLTYSISRDITEQKISQQKIQDLTHTLNQTTIVLVLDDEERILSVNDKFCETSGYARSEVLDQPYAALQSAHHKTQFWLALRGTIRAGKIWQGEIRERTKTGEHYWTHTSIVPFINDRGEPSQYIVTQSDITDRKNLEEKLREAKKEADKNAKIKEDFLANMSHEIRTPMNGVLGFSRLLLQTEMDGQQHEYAQSIYSSAENLLVIVNDILDVSKIESGTFQLHEIPFNLKKRIEEGLSILNVSVQKKNLAFTIDIDPDIPTVVLGVPDRLSQILINLVGNATKFTKEGQVQLSVRLKNNWLVFEVKDTGIGIPADKVDTIFDSFTQAENYTTREYSGTGLGLSISRKLVNVMGGQIGVQSVLGEGSTFYFTLPFKQLPQSKKNAAGDAQLDDLGAANKVPLVLVVEDNTVNQELTQIYLNLLECDYHTAYNGAEALEKVQNHTYDLILMDIQMPKMDGIAATTAIRSMDYQMPIVAMSAHALEREREKCFEIGMNDYITKPFKVEVLQEVLEQHLTLPTKKAHAATPRVQHLDAKRALAESSLLQQADPHVSRELLQLFKQELEGLAVEMEQALAEEDTKTIQRLMHKIKSNFQLLNLPQFYAWSDEMEHLAGEQASMATIKVVYQQFEAALPALLEQIAWEIRA